MVLETAGSGPWEGWGGGGGRLPYERYGDEWRLIWGCLRLYKFDL